MRVLIACEFSGIVREAFRQRGHDAWSCDLLPTEIEGQHIQGDVLDILGDGWDLMVAHPPCTYICNSGVSWLYKRDGRWDDMRAGALFFKALWNAPIPRIAIENPIPHKYALRIIGRMYNQVIQPYMFGHAESKATCLWLKGLPQLRETNNVFDVWRELPDNIAQRIHHLPPSSERGKLRSITFSGIAGAMVGQWGSLDMPVPFQESLL